MLLMLFEPPPSETIELDEDLIKLLLLMFELLTFRLSDFEDLDRSSQSRLSKSESLEARLPDPMLFLYQITITSRI